MLKQTKRIHWQPVPSSDKGTSSALNYARQLQTGLTGQLLHEYAFST